MKEWCRKLQETDILLSIMKARSTTQATTTAKRSLIIRHKRTELRKRRSGYDSYIALILLISVYFSALFGTDYYSHDPAAAAAAAASAAVVTAHQHLPSTDRRSLLHQDFSEYSCDDLYQHAKTDKDTQCLYARTCNDGDGIFAPMIYCSKRYSSQTLILFLGAPLVLLLIVLFRILGSTAEEFFSPGLEMFSIKLGLPERFAAVTLLALGNGAPDVASTVNAIRNDRKRGYLLALGELTGAAMVASTVIVGAVAFVSSKPVPCRGAFVRDVVMFIITMIVVYSALNDGTIDLKGIKMFVGMYLGYVLIVLAADVYHKRLVESEQQSADEAEQQSADEGGHETSSSEEPTETTALNAAAIPGRPQLAMSVGSYELSLHQKTESRAFWSSTSRTSPRESPPVMRKVMEAISNYSDIPEIQEGQAFTDAEQQQQQQQGTTLDGVAAPRRHHPLVHSTSTRSSSGWGERDANGTEPLMVFHPHHGGMVDLKHMEALGGGGGAASLSSDEEEEMHSWLDIRQEMADYFIQFWDEAYNSAQFNVIDKLLMTCELPFTMLRIFSVPVPCDGYYCRPLLALSVALSPLWLCYYFFDQFNINIMEQPWSVMLSTFGIPLLIGLLVLRFAPRGDSPPRPLAAVPLTLIGFVVSATWLDLVADKLVNLMSFFGIICRIPSTIMGLTFLAWGNSSQDLIANMTVARKDLSTMAITASFAGPVFNILVGLGLGFGILHASKPDKTINVHLDNPLRIGFLFSVLNGALMIVSGICVGKGTIPKKYGYAAMVVYFIYVAVSISI